MVGGPWLTGVGSSTGGRVGVCGRNGPARSPTAEQNTPKRYGGDDGECGKADTGGDALDVTPAASAEVPQHHRQRAPPDRAGDVVDQERAVPHARHSGEAGDEDAERGGEPAEEHGLPAAFGEVRLGTVEVAGLHEPAHRPV